MIDSKLLESFKLLCETVLSQIDSHELVLLGESHFDSKMILLEQCVIERSIKKYGIRHIGLEIPNDTGNEILSLYRAEPKIDWNEYPESFQIMNKYLLAIDAGNTNLPDNDKAIPFFFDMPKDSTHKADCGDNQICTEMIKATTRYFKERDPYMSEFVEGVFRERKGKLLLIIGRSHIYKHQINFGIPELARQLKEDETRMPIVQWNDNTLEFPELSLDDVFFYYKPLGLRLIETLGADVVSSIFVNSNSHTALNDYFNNNNINTPIVVQTSDSSYNSVFWWLQQESLYKHIAEEEQIPVSKMFDIFLQL